MAVTLIFGLLAALCAVYYIIIVSYSGFHTAFASVWAVLVAFFLIIALTALVLHRKHIKLPVGIKAALISVLCIGVVFFAAVETVIVSGMMHKPSDDLDYVIVLGAQVRGTRITKSLGKRLETAYDYLKNNPDTVAVVSGGQGTGEDISEAQAMRDYLVERGIPEERIIMEDKSTNTDENIEFSMDIIQNDSDSGEFSAGIITNNFHVYRASAVCAKKGYDVEGIAAPSDERLFLNYMLREFFAVVQYKVTGRI